MPRSSPSIEIAFYLPEDEKDKVELGKMLGQLHGKYAEEILRKNIYDSKRRNEIMKELWDCWMKENERE